MTTLREVPVEPRPGSMRPPGSGAARCGRRGAPAAGFRARLGARTIWNVSAAAVGGGVAEMLQVLIGYAAGLDFPVRWTVISGDSDFFATTKRLHNQLHGEIGQAGPLGAPEARHYQEVLAANADDLLALVHPGDVALLHDPQTAGLASALDQAGVSVVWRSHIGVDWRNDATDAAWQFLRPYLGAARGYIFTRRQYVPAWIPSHLTWIVPPSIDPFSAKNQDLDPAAVIAILMTVGLLAGDPGGRPGPYTRRDGTASPVTRPGPLTCGRLPGPTEPVLVQVSRWDRLKDMAGVMSGFAEYVVPGGRGYLMLVGPDVGDVADDPEGAMVFADCFKRWQELPATARERVLLATLPLDDVEENAAMVNAVQRHATVIAQKSLAEGFGLTVAEGMWKGRPVIGSAVGGIRDQIRNGSGVLLPDATDLAAFGGQVRRLLDHPEDAARMGRAGRKMVSKRFLGDRHLLQLAEVIGAAAPD